MYFLPILAAILTYLAVPSVVLAMAVGLLLFAYVSFAGERIHRGVPALLRGQLAHRIMTVKLLSLNGELDEDTYTAHAKLTPDQPENAELRGLLRDAAATYGAGWRDFTRTVRKVYGRQPEELVSRYENVILQMRCQPGGLTDDTQSRLVELAKIWKIGPETAKGFLAANRVPLAPAMLAFN